MTPDHWLALLSVLAVLISPIAALELQKWMDDRRAALNRKMEIFRKLMTTRSTQLSPAHVEALNAIEVEFYAIRGPDKKVLDAWREYINQLNSPAGTGEALNRWVDKKNTLLIALLYEMAKRLKYDIDKVAIEKNVYHPVGFVEIETEQHALRKAALAVFSGERPIQATVVGKVQTALPMSIPDEINPPQLVASQHALAAPKTVGPPLKTVDAEVVTRPDKA